MTLAVRARLTGEALATCPREESFAEIYAALGDAEAQEEIRRDSPDRGHCKLLTNPKFGPSFCTACPNNPYLPFDPVTGKPNPRARQLALADEVGPAADELIGRALRLRYGLTVPEMGLREEMLVVAAASELDATLERRAANEIARRIAELLAVMLTRR